MKEKKSKTSKKVFSIYAEPGIMSLVEKLSKHLNKTKSDIISEAIFKYSMANLPAFEDEQGGN